MRGQDGEVGAVHDLVSQRLSEQLVRPAVHCATAHPDTDSTHGRARTNLRSFGRFDARRPGSGTVVTRQPYVKHIRNTGLHSSGTSKRNQGYPVQRHPYFRPGPETHMLGYERYVMLLWMIGTPI